MNLKAVAVEDDAANLEAVLDPQEDEAQEENNVGETEEAADGEANPDVEEEANTCTIAGWGDTKSKKDDESCLRWANVPVLSNKKCRKLFEKSSNPKQISNGR